MLLRVPVEVTLLLHSYVEVDTEDLDEAKEMIRNGLYNTLEDITEKQLGQFVYYDEAEQVNEIGE